MRQLPVQLDGELVLLVVHVPVHGLAVDDDAHLMPGPRQTVGALDVPQVPVFQYRVNSVTGGRENVAELIAPASGRVQDGF
jgi:hypothetical protein